MLILERVSVITLASQFLNSRFCTVLRNQNNEDEFVGRQNRTCAEKLPSKLTANI